jgi:hypothetical protein
MMSGQSDDGKECAPSMSITPMAPRTDRYHVSVDEYVHFHSQGYLVVKGLVSPAEIAELIEHTDNLRYGRGHPRCPSPARQSDTRATRPVLAPCPHASSCLRNPRALFAAPPHS